MQNFLFIVVYKSLGIIQNSEVIESVQIINEMVPENIAKALVAEHVGTIICRQT